MEFSAMHPNYVSMFSVDDKAKLQVSQCPMIERRTKTGRSFLAGSAPIVPDHDVKVSIHNAYISHIDQKIPLFRLE